MKYETMENWCSNFVHTCAYKYTNYFYGGLILLVLLATVIPFWIVLTIQVGLLAIGLVALRKWNKEK